jgi:hypothetical protein
MNKEEYQATMASMIEDYMSRMEPSEAGALLLYLLVAHASHNLDTDVPDFTQDDHVEMHHAITGCVGTITEVVNKARVRLN